MYVPARLDHSARNGAALTLAFLDRAQELAEQSGKSFALSSAQGRQELRQGGKVMLNGAVRQLAPLRRQANDDAASILRVRYAPNEPHGFDAVDTVGNCPRRQQGLAVEVAWSQFEGWAGTAKRYDQAEGLPSKAEWREPLFGASQ